ncbi:hypothetical protein D3C80_1480800 [compost metagenome]
MHASAVSATRAAGITTTPSSSPMMRSPGETSSPPITIDWFSGPSVSLTAPLIEIDRLKTGNPIRSMSLASRTPPSTINPASPLPLAALAITSPNRPCSVKPAAAQTTTSPGFASCRAAWRVRLSPGGQTQVNAGPRTRIPLRIGLIAESSAPLRPMASCAVAAVTFSKRARSSAVR